MCNQGLTICVVENAERDPRVHLPLRPCPRRAACVPALREDWLPGELPHAPGNKDRYAFSSVVLLSLINIFKLIFEGIYALAINIDMSFLCFISQGVAR